VALGLALFCSAHAEGGAPARPAAADTPHYRSAFADYKPWQDVRPGDWRALNDALKGGSMAGMAMPGDGLPTAAAPPSAAAHGHAPPGAASTPMHAGHAMKGGRP
jgi:hypothetical protein